MILVTALIYRRDTASYRDREKSLAERRQRVDHATLCRWAATDSPPITRTARHRKAAVDQPRRMDETPVKVQVKVQVQVQVKVMGARTYLCRAVDKLGKTPGCLLSKRRKYGRHPRHQPGAEAL